MTATVEVRMSVPLTVDAAAELVHDLGVAITSAHRRCPAGSTADIVVTATDDHVTVAPRFLPANPAEAVPATLADLSVAIAAITDVDAAAYVCRAASERAAELRAYLVAT